MNEEQIHTTELWDPEKTPEAMRHLLALASQALDPAEYMSLVHRANYLERFFTNPLYRQKMLRPLNLIRIAVLPQTEDRLIFKDRILLWPADKDSKPLPAGAVLHHTITIAEARKLRMSLKLRKSSANHYWKQLTILSPELKLDKDSAYSVLFGFVGHMHDSLEPVMPDLFTSIVKEFILERDVPLDSNQEWPSLPCIDIAFDGKKG